MSHAYLNLQEVITAHALVMHVVIGLVGIATILVLDEGEAGSVLDDPYRLKREASTYSLLVADRGAGMSQRTSLPKL